MIRTQRATINPSAFRTTYAPREPYKRHQEPPRHHQRAKRAKLEPIVLAIPHPKLRVVMAPGTTMRIARRSARLGRRALRESI